MEWGTGDLISIFVGLAFLAVMLSFKKNRTAERAIYVLANGISLGALLLIVISPAAQLAGYHVNLLEVAVKEGKLTLWWGAVLATIHLVKDSL